MAKRESVVKQVEERMQELSALGIGRSRHVDKSALADYNKGIRSFDTLKTYLKWGVDYAKWAQAAHGCRYIADADNLD